MNSYDLGCGPGGGDTAPQVFKAAGLAFSDGDHRTEIRKSEDRGGRGVGGGRIRRKEGPEGERQEEEGWEGLGWEGRLRGEGEALHPPADCSPALYQV